MATTEGTFVRHELTRTDVASARAFRAPVAGWRLADPQGAGFGPTGGRRA